MIPSYTIPSSHNYRDYERLLETVLQTLVVHKRMSILTFEGLPTTFEASTNVYFTYFCHKIKCYNGNICIKVASKMFSSNN